MLNILSARLILTAIAAIFISYLMFPRQSNSNNKHLIDTKSKLKTCPVGQFILPSMSDCHNHLTCRDFDDIKISNQINEGGVKRIYQASWKSIHTVTISILKSQEYHDDYSHGVNMLLAFQQSDHVTKYVGRCKHMLISEYHPNGSMLNLSRVLENAKNFDRTPQNCLGLCVIYSQILHFLHASPAGVRVMCDSNDLDKLLSQFLITDDLKFIANDLDALPEVLQGSQGITCGPREIVSDFVAPEQLWPYENKEFDLSEQPQYSEKTDIYKAAAVCEFIMNQCCSQNHCQSDEVDYNKPLTTIYDNCRNRNSHLRPTAYELMNAYLDLINTIDNNGN